MLEHLINGEFHPEVVDATAEVLSFEKADPTATIDAKVKTAQWLKDLELEDDEIETKADAEAARKSFASLVTGQPVGNTQQALANIKAPAAVALFTERVEVKKTEMSDVELEMRIKEKLNRFMGVIDVVDVTEDKDEA